jgi:putative copper export protein
MQIKLLILIHLLGASIWIGGHLILTLSVLPQALRDRDPGPVKKFEQQFEKVGLPALMMQAVTGIWMSLIYVPATQWFSFDNVMSNHIALKIFLISGTIILAVHARFFIIPRLSADTLSYLGFHILAITIISLALLFTGLNFRLDII